MHIIHNVSSVFKDNHLVRSLMPIAHPAPPSRPHTPAHLEPEAQKYDQGGGGINYENFNRQQKPDKAIDVSGPGQVSQLQATN